MNAALCFSGLVRTLNECYSSIQEVILNPLKQKFDVDIFGSFPKNEESLKMLKFTDVEIVKDIDSDKLINQYLKNIDSACNLPYIDLFLRQWSSWKNVSNLRQKYEFVNNKQYDWVFRIRTDEVFQKQLEDLSTLDNKYIYIPNHDNHGGINDCFAFSSPKNMDIYLNMINYIEGYLLKGTKLDPEYMLLTHLKENNIEIKRTNILACTNRPLNHPKYPGIKRPSK